MDNALVTKQDIEIKRGADDLYEFVRATFDSIRRDPDERKLARLKTSIYKELIEEVYPFSIFCKIKYQDRNVLCQPVLGDQGFDAIIESEKGELVENIEISWPIDGQKHYTEVRELNEKGYTKLEIRDIDDNTPREEMINRIIKKANDKALIDYFTSEGSSLVFVFDVAPYFGMNKIDHLDEIERLKQELAKITFKVQCVYLLLLPIQELSKIK